MASSYSNSNDESNSEQAFQENNTAPVSLQEDETPHHNNDEAAPNDASATASKVSCARPGRKPRNPAVLILWIEEHSQNPYPSKAEKTLLAHYAGMTQRQLNDWFANARRNIKKVGYSSWKEKHSAYSACFSFGHVFRHNASAAADIGRSGRTVAAQFPSIEVPANSLTSSTMPGSDGLKIASYAGRRDPSVPQHAATPALPVVSKPTTNLNQRAFPYFIPSQSSLVNVAAAHQAPTGVNTLRQVAMNPAAAYYHSAACIQPVQSVSALNFRSMNQPNVAIFSSASRPCSLQPQFNPSSISITSPWTNNTTSVACESVGVKQEAAVYPITSNKAHSPQVNIESPISIQGPTSPAESEAVEGTSSQNEPLSAVAQSVATPESTWAVSLTQPTSSHHLFADYSVSASQTGQELENQWDATTLYQQARSFNH